jgi:hypothetical protein
MIVVVPIVLAREIAMIAPVVKAVTEIAMDANITVLIVNEMKTVLKMRADK